MLKCGVPPQRGAKSIANINRGGQKPYIFEKLHYNHYSFFLRGGQTPLPISMGEIAGLALWIRHCLLPIHSLCRACYYQFRQLRNSAERLIGRVYKFDHKIISAYNACYHPLVPPEAAHIYIYMRIYIYICAYIYIYTYQG